jgi:hypothetical protein
MSSVQRYNVGRKGQSYKGHILTAFAFYVNWSRSATQPLKWGVEGEMHLVVKLIHAFRLFISDEG